MSAPLPRWLATENAVQRLFELQGFEVRHISIEGRQIDLVAEKSPTMSLRPETWVVEITTEMVGADKGGKDYQKLMLARTRHPNASMLLISTAGFTDDQAASLKALDVLPLTYAEFEEKTLSLRRYALAAMKAAADRSAPDIGYAAARYVEPELEVRLTDAATARPESGDAWIDRVLKAAEPGVAALLGNLGAGKTSLLQRASELGCRRYLSSPSTCPIPVYVPLGRYKQHSGSIEQMLLSEFQQAGLATYPVALVKHLIEARRIVLLLDGLDEVHPIQNKDDVLGTIAQLLGSIGTKAAAVISCRRQFLQTTAEELAYFGAYTAGPLQDVQIGLDRALRNHPQTHIVEVRPFDRPRIDRYLQTRCGMDPKATAAFFAQFYGFEEMAQTPVLLSMMATTIEQKLLDPTARLPFPLLALYEAYTDRWIKRDTGRAKLASAVRRALSEALAAHMLWTGRESEEWAYIRDVLRTQEAWKNNPVSDEEADVDIRNSGFLIRDLDDRFRFIHRSLMEYFAAVVELGRLRAGERPRHFPFDGYRMFMAALMAQAWLNGEVPFPRAAWDRGRGDGVLNAQMSMLAAASEALPAGATVGLERVQVVTDGNQRWKQVRFTAVQWGHTGPLACTRCEFQKSTLRLPGGDTRPAFVECRFDDTAIEFGELPSWTKSVVPLDGPQGTLPVPGCVWDLAALTEGGARVSVGNKSWRIGWKPLLLCAEVYRKLQRKIYKDDFLSGAYRDDLVRVLPQLERAGWVQVDRSRPGHQLELTPAARTAVNTLRTDPIGAQDQFACFS